MELHVRVVRLPVLELSMLSLTLKDRSRADLEGHQSLSPLQGSPISGVREGWKELERSHTADIALLLSSVDSVSYYGVVNLRVDMLYK